MAALFKIFTVFLITVLFVNNISCGSIKKKTTEESAPSEDISNLTDDIQDEEIVNKKRSPPAIVAIEIVDEEDNSTDARPHTKRTIESNLGYGFQGGFYNTMKKYMIYPYSQKDIPPAAVSSSVRYGQVPEPGIQVQKAITYNLGTRVEYVPKYPSILYSTVNGNGQLSGLSTHFPANHQHQQQSVPVIILRLYSNQLTDPNHGVYPALPASNPYAYLNRVNLQDIVARYLHQHVYQHQQQPAYQPAVQQQYQPAVQPQQYQHVVQPQQYQPIYQTNYPQHHPDPADDLPTHENYPDDAHTRVIYHHPRGHFRNGFNYANINRNYLPLAGHQKVQPQEYKDISGLRPPLVQNTYAPQPVQNYQYVYEQQVAPQQYQQNTVYMDKNGQSYIYVLPSQLKAYQQQVQQSGEYAVQNQVYYQPTDYQVQDTPVEPSTAAPFNYHAHDAKQQKRRVRNKKNSGRPVTFTENNTNSAESKKGSR